MGNLQFSWEVVVYLLGLAAMWGSLKTRIQNLEKKQDLHNHAIERLTKAEATIQVHEEKHKVANHRLDDLEKRVEKED